MRNLTRVLASLLILTVPLAAADFVSREKGFRVTFPAAARELAPPPQLGPNMAGAEASSVGGRLHRQPQALGHLLGLLDHRTRGNDADALITTDDRLVRLCREYQTTALMYPASFTRFRRASGPAGSL